MPLFGESFTSLNHGIRDLHAEDSLIVFATFVIESCERLFY